MLGGSSLRVHLRKLTHRNWRWSAMSTAASTDDGGKSKIFEASCKFARPATVTWSERLNNTVSLIGTLEYPLKQSGANGAYTILLVKPSPTSPHLFRVTLFMWDLLAETALAFLKPNDYIYVSGRLGSYTKSTLDGTERMYYKVTAMELSYVKVPDENYQVAVKSGSEAGVNVQIIKVEDVTLGGLQDVGESMEQKHNNKLHMWQLLFANPEEWYDSRKNKKNPRGPDFVHKSTREALWLSTYDPPWVKKQVELLDSKLAGRSRSGDEVPFGSFASHLVSDVLLDSSNSTVTATELSDVKVPDENSQVAVKSGSEAGESREQKQNKRVHMLNLLFANPEEWYDSRKTKKNPKQPDFKHKSTGEALWLNAYDPPWVKKQVELLDSRLAG